jgi:hypothetical protein
MWLESLELLLERLDAKCSLSSIGAISGAGLCLSIRFLQADLFEIFTALSDFQFPYVQDSSTALFT